MPSVPVYGGPQLRTEALRPPMQGGVDVSSGLQSLARGVGQVGDVVDRRVERDADTEAWQAQASLLEDFNNWNAEARKNAQGANAKGHSAAVAEWWDKARAERFNGLSPLAQQRVAKSLSTARLGALESAAGYENQQLEIGEKAALVGTLDGLTNQAISAPTNARGAVIDEITKTIRGYGARKGIDVESQVLKATTDVHLNVIRGLAKDQPAEAARYFLENKKQISADRWDDLDALVKTAQRQRSAQDFADTIMPQGLPMSDALDAARKKFSGDEEAAVTAELKTRYAEKEAARSQAVQKLTRTAWAQLMAKGSIARVDPEVMRDLRKEAPEEERQMRDWLDAKFRQARADKERTSDDEMEHYYKLRRLAMDDATRAEFAGRDLMKDAPYVSKNQLRNLIDIQGSINKGDAKAMDLQRQVKQTITAVRGAILEAGIDLTPKEGTDKAKQFAAFMGSLTSALDEAQQAKKDKNGNIQPLTPDEMRQIGMQMLETGIQQGTGIFGAFRTTKRGYEIKADPERAGKTFVSVDFDSIPAEVRSALVADYAAAKGLQRSIYMGSREYILSREDKDAIERAYQRGRQQGRFR